MISTRMVNREGRENTRAPRRSRLLARLGRTVAVLLPMAVAGFFLMTPGTMLAGGQGRAIADQPVEIVLQDKLPIEQFLKAVGTKTGKPLVWDPMDKAIRGKEIVGALNLQATEENLFKVVRALLTFYELVMIPVGPEGYQVQLVMDARRTTSILKLKAEYIELEDYDLKELSQADGLYVTTTIRVKNMTDLRNARAALTRVVTGQQIGNVTEVPDAQAFVVTDFAPNVVAIYRLLQSMDVKPEGKELASEFVQLSHATADEVEPILTDLFTGRERVTTTNRNRPQPRRGNQPTGSGSVADDPEPRIIPDNRTNKIILYATKQDIAEIKKVIEQIDVPLYIRNSNVHVIRLKNLEAEDTATVLQSLIDSSTLFGQAGTNTGNRPGGNNRPAGVASSDPREEEKPAVVADEKSNSLIIAASERQFDDLKKIIDEIDIKKSQVLIEVALIELTLDDAYRLSFELGLADDNGLVNNDEVSGFGLTNFGQTVFADKDGDTFFTDRIPPFVDSDENAAPSGLVGGIFAFGQVPLIFNVLNTISRTRILQLPSVVTADNEEAVIEVLDLQATTESTTSNGGVTSGGFGGFEEAGTILRISPHIADDHYLLLNISLEVSAFAGEPRTLPGGTVVPADKISRRLTTAVTCPDRHTVVLGGLMGRNQQSTVDRTPVLADLPLVGDLFQSTNKSDRETSLFLFVTPTIMSGDEDGFRTLDIESCRRKNKADELIGYTEIYNSRFVGCEPGSANGAGGAVDSGYTMNAPGCVTGSGSASDRLGEIGVLQHTRFHNMSRERLDAERAARRSMMRSGPRGPAPRPRTRSWLKTDTR